MTWITAWYWAVHTLGVDNGLPYGTWNWYNFLSGAGSDLGEYVIAASLLGWFRKNNCGTRWCLRFGHHPWLNPETGVTHVLCRRHHPDHPGRRPISARDISRVHLIHRHRRQL
jgi:hypothetical protein